MLQNPNMTDADKLLTSIEHENQKFQSYLANAPRVDNQELIDQIQVCLKTPDSDDQDMDEETGIRDDSYASQSSTTL